MCPVCGALERHRLLWLYLVRRTDVLRRRSTVLHVAPERALSRRLKRYPNLRYVSTDLLDADVTVRADLTRLSFRDDVFDFVLCSHVLEHIVDDVRALGEICRVVRRGGFAIVHVPLELSRQRTFEDPSITAPEDRLRVFGQSDHVRRYGRDFPDRVAAAGFHIRAEPFVNELPPEQIRRFGLRPDLDPYVYVAVKS